jgi:hypothetical protein
MRGSVRGARTGREPRVLRGRIDPGSAPMGPARSCGARVAQLAEQGTLNPKVLGSIPGAGTSHLCPVRFELMAARSSHTAKTNARTPEGSARLVKRGHLGRGGQADHDAWRRAHPAGQALDRPAWRQAEVGGQRLGQPAIPVRVEPGGHPQRVPDLESRPTDGYSCPAAMRMSVVLPAPLRPSSPVMIRYLPARVLGSVSRG